MDECEKLRQAKEFGEQFSSLAEAVVIEGEAKIQQLTNILTEMQDFQSKVVLPMATAASDALTAITEALADCENPKE